MPQPIHQQAVSPLLPAAEPVPPIPPRTPSRPPSRQQSQSILVPVNPATRPQNNSNYFRLDDLPAPDREWQLLENIGDGTYGEVFRVSETSVHSNLAR